jgi:hypothetical protein
MLPAQASSRHLLRPNPLSGGKLLLRNDLLTRQHRPDRAAAQPPRHPAARAKKPDLGITKYPKCVSCLGYFFAAKRGNPYHSSSRAAFLQVDAGVRLSGIGRARRSCSIAARSLKRRSGRAARRQRQRSAAPADPRCDFGCVLSRANVTLCGAAKMAMRAGA